MSYDSVTIDFDALREQEPALHKAISSITGFDAGDHRIELNKLLMAYQKALREFVEKSGPATAAKPPQPPDNPVAGTKAQEEAKAKQRQVDYDAAMRRLRELETTILLLNCGRNRDLIEEWIKKNVKGYWSAGAVDVAVANLGPRGRNWLQFGKPPEPKPAPAPLLPEAPPEVLGTCSDGQPQLPLQSPEWLLKKSTPAQIRDWQKRRLEVNPKEGIIRRAGFHGSKYERS